MELRQAYGAEAEYRISQRWSVGLGGAIYRQLSDRSNEDIAYFGNLPYDVLSLIGSNGAYWYTRVRYVF